MVLVQLSDVIIPEFLAQYMAENSPVSPSLSQSGVTAGNPLMQVQISQGEEFGFDPRWRYQIPAGQSPDPSHRCVSPAARHASVATTSKCRVPLGAITAASRCIPPSVPG